MKTYNTLKEDIGLSTGIGIANPDPLMGKPVKRNRNYSVFESLGICEEHMVAMKLKEGKLVCELCKTK
jgi:hypothetical protein